MKHISINIASPLRLCARWPHLVRYKTKPPGGAKSAEKTFFDTSIKNSYPTLIEVAPGVFRAVWDSGTADTARTLIHFAKFKLKP